MARSRKHAVGALAGLAALAAGAVALGGTAQAAPDPAAAVGAQVGTAVSAARLGLAASAQSARAGLVTPEAAHAHGSRPAPESDRREIRRAVKHSELASAVDPSDYHVRTIRLSRTDPAWAAAMIRPTVPLDPAAVLAHRVHGHWKVVTLGTAQIGCGQAPAAVLRDFRSYDSIGSCDTR